VTTPPRPTAAVPTLESALDSGVEGLLRGVPPLRVAASDAEHAFALRPLLDAADSLRSAFEGPEPRTPPRAALMARVRWTRQQSPTLAARLFHVTHRVSRRLTAFAMSGALRRRATPVAIFALVLLMAAAFASSSRSAAASTLTILEGTVEVHTTEGWQPLHDGAPVESGARVRLASGAVALLTFADGSVLRLAEEADIELTQATFQGVRDVNVLQRAGAVQATVALDARSGAMFTLTSPGCFVEVVGGAFTSSVTADGGFVSGVRGRVDVHRTVLDGAAPGPPLAPPEGGTQLQPPVGERPAGPPPAREDLSPPPPAQRPQGAPGTPQQRPGGPTEGAPGLDMRSERPGAPSFKPALGQRVVPPAKGLPPPANGSHPTPPPR
jgi:FecR protein